VIQSMIRRVLLTGLRRVFPAWRGRLARSFLQTSDHAGLSKPSPGRSKSQNFASIVVAGLTPLPPPPLMPPLKQIVPPNKLWLAVWRQTLSVAPVERPPSVSFGFAGSFDGQRDSQSLKGR
jgi:hypothetical protein